MFKAYYNLAKPGIIYGNVLTTVAGFILASRTYFQLALFIEVVVGLSLVIGSGCVFNNCLDREIDKKMARTQKRALVTGAIPIKNALTYGSVLGFLGFGILDFYTNPLTTLLALIGFIFYVWVYGYFKRRSIYGTEIGSISGAIPIVVGYCAVANKFDLGALLLFLIMVFWQMPHFYGIAIYRLKDYTAAKLPVLPAKEGIQRTKIQMVAYLLAFLITVPLLTIFGYAGKVYLLIIGLLGLVWFWTGLKGFWVKDEKKWGRKVFFTSLIVVMGLYVAIALDKLIVL